MDASSIITTVNVNAINQFNTNTGSGGSFSWQDANVYVGSSYQLDANSGIGINVRDGYQNWSWSNVSGYGNKTPWKGIQSPGIGLSYFQKLEDGWGARLAPIIDWVAENGVGTVGSATYGQLQVPPKDILTSSPSAWELVFFVKLIKQKFSLTS